MLCRLLPALVLMMPVGAGQMGIYGTATGHPRAGDAAPDLVFREVLSSPVAGSWTQAMLSGQVTVLGFFPDTSHNREPVAEWNARVDEFAGRHVQFVWITGEDKRTLMPALEKHPIKGWVLYDREGATAKAYGLDMPVNVYIGPDGRIVGFQQGSVPDEETLNAVLDGRVVLTRPTAATLKEVREGNLVALDSAPARMPRAADYRPQFAPSDTVHITLANGGERGNFGSDDYWVLRGVTLKEILEEVYGVSAVRMELPASLNTARRYDVALLLPHPERREAMKERVKQALQQYFHVTVERELRVADVYVLSREPGRTPPLERPSEFELPGHPGGGSRETSVGFMEAGGSDKYMGRPRAQGLDALVGIAEEGTMDDLCHDLEGTLDRPVVNETHLEGRYRVQVQVPAGSKINFSAALREQTGLVIGRGQRKVAL